MKRKIQAETRSIEERMSFLEAGDLSVEEARAAIRGLLRNDNGEKAAIKTYEALRGWLGASLRERNASAYLRDWYSLIEAVAAQFEEVLPLWAARFEVLSDLLRDRVAIEEARTPKEILQRQHVPQLLDLLAQAAGGTLARTEIMEKLGLGQANLSRVLRLARDAGLLDRETKGKEAEFALSGLGFSLLAEGSKDDRVIPEFDLIGQTWTSEDDAASALFSVNDQIDLRDYVSAIEEPDPLPLAA